MMVGFLTLLAAAAGVLLIAFPASTALADVTPPTLTGEQFFDPAPNITPTCNPNGTSTISFSSSGVASGPYTGMFTETGTATLGPQSFDQNGTPLGSLLTFDAVFTIQSSAGDVTGTKTLVLPITNPAIQFAIGQCATVGIPPQQEELINVNAAYTVHYEAEISAPAGEFADRGVNPHVFLNRITVLDDNRIIDKQFFEDFLSDLTTTEPLTTPGQATGGGQVPGNVTFGLTAKSDKNGVKGDCTVIDRSTNTTLKCLDATTYAQTGTQATFSGHATVNGAPTTYRIHVSDQGEPGTADTFTITTMSGYSAGGTLTQGNIQVHA